MVQYISFLFTNKKVYFPLGVCCWTDPPLSDNLLLSYSWTFLITDYLTGRPGSYCSFFEFLVYHVVLFGIIMSDMKIHEYSWFVMERIKTGFIISPHCSFSIFLMISIIDQFSVKLTPDNNRRLCGTVDTARPNQNQSLGRVALHHTSATTFDNPNLAWHWLNLFYTESVTRLVLDNLTYLITVWLTSMFTWCFKFNQWNIINLSFTNAYGYCHFQIYRCEKNNFKTKVCLNCWFLGSHWTNKIKKIQTTDRTKNSGSRKTN